MTSSAKRIEPSDPPKNPIIAALLSLILLGGVGQLYLGQNTKGIILIVVWVIGWCTFGLLTAIAAIIGAIDAYVIADKLQNGESVGENQWFWES